MDSLDFWNRIAESSPLIVLVLLGGIAVGARIIHLLIVRLDKKDELIVGMQHDTLEAINGMRQAIEKLSSAIERSR